MTIDKIKELAFSNAINKGFYDCKVCKGKGCTICANTGIEKKMNIPERLMLCVSELSEAMEAHRKNNFTKHKISTDDVRRSFSNVLFFEENIKDTFEDELADVIIRVLDLCEYLKIDIDLHIKAKMNYNLSRPKLNGDKLY